MSTRAVLTTPSDDAAQTPVPSRTQYATRLTVEKTVKRHTLTSGGQIVPIAPPTDETVDVHTFVTTPATVTAKAGQTINLGNYESLRLDIGITMPCYAEEVAEAIEAATELVGQKMLREVQDAKAQFGAP